MVRIKCSVFLGRKGYQGVVHGQIGGRTVWSDRTGIVRDDIMAAYTDARIAASRMRA